MDEFDDEVVAESELPEAPATSPRWAGLPYIAVAQQLNLQWIELFCQLAGNSSYPELPLCVLQNRSLWHFLDSKARARVAALPFVIIDLRFRDAAWWRELVDRAAMTPADSTPLVDLLLETLLFARQAAREDASVAKTMFAMTPSVAQLIASLSLPQVRSIASGSVRELRVRCDHDSEFWGDFLIACQGADEPEMAALHRQAKLLFCGEAIS